MFSPILIDKNRNNKLKPLLQLWHQKSENQNMKIWMGPSDRVCFVLLACSFYDMFQYFLPLKKSDPKYTFLHIGPILIVLHIQKEFSNTKLLTSPHTQGLGLFCRNNPLVTKYVQFCILTKELQNTLV